eukprot:4830048-Pleurochrysis_carterae.AAC.1
MTNSKLRHKSVSDNLGPPKNNSRLHLNPSRAAGAGTQGQHKESEFGDGVGAIPFGRQCEAGSVKHSARQAA